MSTTAPAAGASSPWPARAAIAACAVGAVVIALSIPGVVGAILLSAPTPADAPGQSGGAKYEAAMDGAVAMIEGRSLFFVPAPPSPPPPKTVDAHDDAAPAPTVYGGPELVAMFAGAAWFSDGSRRAPADGEMDGLRVLRLVPPWEAVVLWRGTEFTLDLFERDRVVFPDTSGARASEASVALESGAPLPETRNVP